MATDTPRTDSEIAKMQSRPHSENEFVKFTGSLERELAETKRLLVGLREAAEKCKYLVEAAEKVSANIVDGQSMRVSIEDLIALKDTVAALNKEQSCS
jgi:hypothetical protein